MTRVSMWIALAIALGTGAEGKSSKPPLEVDAAIERGSTGSWVLEFEVTNPAPTAVSVPLESIPWLCTKHFLVLAGQYQPGGMWQPLPGASRASEVECPSGEDHVVEAGRSISGSVNLEDHVANFGVGSGARRTVVFWLWRPHISSGTGHEVHGGYQILELEERGDESHDSGPVFVDAVAMDEIEPAMLGFVVENPGKDPVSVRFLDVPWLSHSGTILQAVALDTMAPIEEIGAIRDIRGPTAWLTLPPGTFMTGEIPLYKRFSNFDGVLREQGIVVFWLYDGGRTTDGAAIAPHGGLVRFSGQR